MFVVRYKGRFGFIKPWMAVRDGETFSQQFLTPSVIEGIEKKLFPELLSTKGIHKIIRHKLSYDTLSEQQEVTQTRDYKKGGKGYHRPTAILKRSVLVNPVLYLAFQTEDDALRAVSQHVCLCRNEDVLLPEDYIEKLDDAEFSAISGFELKFGESEQSFIVGYNRFDDSRPMYGWLEYSGKQLI